MEWGRTIRYSEFFAVDRENERPARETGTICRVMFQDDLWLLIELDHWLLVGADIPTVHS